MNRKPASQLAVFEGRRIRKILHEDSWRFVITDVIAALTDSVNPADYLKKMRKRDPELAELLKGGGQFVPPLALEFATAGGVQKMQCWNLETPSHLHVTI